jgi:hypothetical protein
MTQFDLGMAAGCALMLIGGYLADFLRGRDAKRAKTSGPVCEGCGHHRSFHGTGENAGCKMDSQYLAACKCVAYTGPIPYPTYFAPEID